jgi:hypothetical protein
VTLEPLRREVEPPSRPFGPWLPITLLASAMSLTIAMTFAVMTAPPREVSIDDAAWKLRDHPIGCSGMGGTRSRTSVPAVPAVLERTGALAACMREWADRSHGTAATVTAGFRVSLDGKVGDVETAGASDRTVTACIATTLRDIRFPAAPHVTAVQVEVKYVEGQTRVFATRVGNEPTPSRGRSGLVETWRALLVRGSRRRSWWS